MAKKDTIGCVEAYKPSLYIDFDDAEEAAEFLESIDGTVTVIIQGTLASVSVSSENSNSIRIEDFKVEKVDNNLFAELADD